MEGSPLSTTRHSATIDSRRDNGLYADSFPLRCHFHGGEGGLGLGGGGGLGGQLEGAGGLQTPT